MRWMRSWPVVSEHGTERSPTSTPVDPRALRRRLVKPRSAMSTAEPFRPSPCDGDADACQMQPNAVLVRKTLCQARFVSFAG